MATVMARKRVTVDRVMKYSGFQETWDFLPGKTTVPDQVASELVAEYAELEIVSAPAPQGAGDYANRMMTTGKCATMTSRGVACGRGLPCRYHTK